ncbi:MAG: erythromycin esterase family protein [Bryobacteraceae bacterium]
MRLITRLSISLAIGGLACAAADQVVDADAVKQWLTKDAIPLKTVEAGHGFDDLKPLKKVLRNVHLVGLGEATHGSREFFQMKHRMLEFLVREMGFTVFAIEASYPACWNINDYVLYGKGDRAKALASQGFWTWDTNEVSDMIDWMRAYNEKAPENKKVKFLGYDLQNFSRTYEVINAYLNKVAPEYVPTAEDAFNDLKLPASEYGKRPDEQRKQETARILELLGFLGLHETEFVRKTSQSEFDEAMQEARILAEYDEAYGQNPAKPGRNLRDFYMAENIAYLVNQQPAGTKMVIWAHNGHIQTTAYGGGVPSMGSHLRKMYGDSYYAFGFTLYEGGLQSREMKPTGAGGLKEFTLPPAPEGSVGWYFNLPGISKYIVDLRAAPKEGPVAEFLSMPHPMTSVGSGFNTSWTTKQYMAPTVLKDAFDGIIFIKKTTRARPNPTGMRS